MERLPILPASLAALALSLAPCASALSLSGTLTDLSGAPIPGATVMTHDFLDEAAPGMLKEALDGPADVVLSDMAAPTTAYLISHCSTGARAGRRSTA